MPGSERDQRPSTPRCRVRAPPRRGGGVTRRTSRIARRRSMASTLSPWRASCSNHPSTSGSSAITATAAPVPVGDFDRRCRMRLVDEHRPAGELVVLAFERFDDEPGEVRVVWRRHDLDEASRAWRARLGRKLPSTSASMSAIVVDGRTSTTRSVAPSVAKSPRWNAMRSEPSIGEVDDAEVALRRCCDGCPTTSSAPKRSVATAQRHDGTATLPIDAHLVAGARALRRAALAQRIGGPQHADGVDHIGDEPSGGRARVDQPGERLGRRRR